jgi:hypothetical protein
MTVTVTARPSTHRPSSRTPKDPSAATLKSALSLIKSARLTGAHDRDLLNAVRMLRNEIQWNPENKALWKAGVSAFDKNDKLQGGHAVDTFVPPAELKSQMAQAEQLAASGDKVGAVRIYRSLIVDYTEHAPVWRAALKLFEPSASPRASGWTP